MSDFLPHPQQCIWLSNGRLVECKTRQNTRMGEPFTATDVLSLTDNAAVMTSFTSDITCSSPTPGFDVVIEGRIFNHDIRFTAQLKIEGIFTYPRAGGYPDLVGVNGTLFNDREPPLIFKAFLNLGRREDRWDLPRCYLIGESE